jgi:predicted metal-dependent peptidase|tara:strand:- start:709 stop:2082 length:1374 start_codon:yes stop_codon:yes gene_type:complete
MSIAVTHEKQLHRMNMAKAECFGLSVASSAILTPIPIVVDDRQPTACTDGKKIFFSSKFVATLNPLELAGLVLHEAEHIKLMHALRMSMLMERGYTPKEINVAADYIVNGILRSMKGYGTSFTLPEGHLFHDKYSNGSGYSLEQVVEELRKDAPPPPPDEPDGPDDPDGGDSGPSDGEDEPSDGEGDTGDDTGDDSGGPGPSGDQDQGPPVSDGTGCGDIIPMSDVDATDPAQVMSAVNEIGDCLTRADIAAKVVGSAAGGSTTRVNNSDLVSKTVPVQVIKRFIRDFVRSKTTWKRPSRRFISQNIYMPAKARHPLRLYCCMDTSGSVTMDQTRKFRDNLVTWSSVSGIDKIMMSYVDSTLHVNKDTGKPWFEIATANGRKAKDMVLDLHGGGGTSFDPIFDNIAESRNMVRGLIYFTDGWGVVTAPKPPFPVLWVTTGVAPTFRNTPAWGEVVYI